MLCTPNAPILLNNESDSQLSLSVDALPLRGIEASQYESLTACLPSSEGAENP